MRIVEMRCQPVGPLAKPVFFQGKKNCIIVYDENEAGKTSLVDIIVNMLFKKGSAQSRFQSRRFSDYQGYVKLEYRGKKVICKGSADLDRHLGFPAEFSRLPIVRGSDLRFLWSGKREKKGPLIEACIQHFSVDFENNLSTVVADVRSAAGLPAKRNCWTKGKLEEMKRHFDLYSRKESLLSLMAGKEETKRQLQAVCERLRQIKDELAVSTREQRELAEEREAALCSSAKVWERKLTALRVEFRERGYERCSREDLRLWGESAVVERSLGEKEASLKSRIMDAEAGLFELRRQQEKVSRCLKEAEQACASVKETLARLRQDKEKQDRERSRSLAEARALLNSTGSAMEQRNKMKWAFAAGILLVAAAVGLFTAGLLLIGGVSLFAGLAVFGWVLAVSGTCGKTIKEAEQGVWRLAREAGVKPAGTLGEVVLLLEKQMREQEDQMRETMKKTELEYQEQEDALQKLVQGDILCARELERLSEILREDRSSLQECTRERDGARLTLENLMQKTGKPDRDSLEKALQERELVERGIEKAVTHLSTLLGGEQEWRERLLALEPFLEQCTGPRPLQELDEIKSRLDERVLELRSGESELQQHYDKLRQQELEEFQGLYAAGCGDVASLVLRLEEAEQVLKSAIRESLAAIWVQQVVEAARDGVEEILLEPLNRAGEIFHQITGRYDTLKFTRREGDVTFSVSDQGTAYSEDLLSDGARAQLMISLRLALLEGILGEEPGFLVLDDPLLNSSAARKRNAIEILLDYAKKGWQVFYLTVDGAAVEIFRKYGGDLVEFRRVSDFYR